VNRAARAADDDMAAILRSLARAGRSWCSTAFRRVTRSGSGAGRQCIFLLQRHDHIKNWTQTDRLTACPADRLLLETDAPYLAPVPHRGNATSGLRARRRGAGRGRCAGKLRRLTRRTRKRRRCFGSRIDSSYGPQPPPGPFRHRHRTGAKLRRFATSRRARLVGRRARAVREVQGRRFRCGALRQRTPKGGSCSSPDHPRRRAKQVDRHGGRSPRRCGASQECHPGDARAVARSGVRRERRRAAGADMRRSCRWRTSTCIHRRFPRDCERRTTCCRRCSTRILHHATPSHRRAPALTGAHDRHETIGPCGASCGAGRRDGGPTREERFVIIPARSHGDLALARRDRRSRGAAGTHHRRTGRGDKTPCVASDLKAQGAMTLLLKTRSTPILCRRSRVVPRWCTAARSQHRHG